MPIGLSAKGRPFPMFSSDGTSCVIYSRSFQSMIIQMQQKRLPSKLSCPFQCLSFCDLEKMGYPPPRRNLTIDTKNYCLEMFGTCVSFQIWLFSLSTLNIRGVKLIKSHKSHSSQPTLNHLELEVDLIFLFFRISLPAPLGEKAACRKRWGNSLGRKENTPWNHRKVTGERGGSGYVQLG